MAVGGEQEPLAHPAMEPVGELLPKILRSVRLRGTAYFRAQFRAPWGMQIQDTGVANFHLVVGGSCYLRNASGACVHLSDGDIAVFPRGASHTLASSPASASVPASQLLSAPHTTGRGLVFGGHGDVTTTLICGHFEIEQIYRNSFFEALPDCLVVRAEQHDQGDAEWVQTATELVARESASNRETSAIVVDRLAEALLVQVLRAYIRQHADDRSFLAGLADGGLAQALQALHAQPAAAWTIEALAGIARMSRTSFLTAFRERIGTSPMKYLAQIRMQRALDQLANSDATIGAVAMDAGYDSEFAFSRAFKRETGLSPGEARRRTRERRSG